jgi:predicted dithiol-disulfide oxidoreductase (DUF899 family)
MSLPQIVDEQQWRESNAALIEKEKAATRAGDALAAERRRQPMMAFDTGFEFDGPYGRVSFLDLFEGRPQLVLYHFWFPEKGEPCGGCSMFTDQLTHLAHLHARGVSFALVSRASQERIAAYKDRMGWEIPWYTDDLAFQEYCGTTDYFRFQVFLRDGDDAYLTYETTGRGSEAIGTVWSVLDRTPYGRQEEWEDTPEGRPQGPPYQWWRKHDEY